VHARPAAVAPSPKILTVSAGRHVRPRASARWLARGARPSFAGNDPAAARYPAASHLPHQLYVPHQSQEFAHPCDNRNV